MCFSSRNPGEIMENFKIVNETIIEERKTEIVGNFVCDTCGHKSTSARKLKVHISLCPVSTAKKCFNKFTVKTCTISLYLCEVCDKKITMKANLKNHQKSVHENLIKKLFNMSKSYW